MKIVGHHTMCYASALSAAAASAFVTLISFQINRERLAGAVWSNAD